MRALPAWLALLLITAILGGARAACYEDVGCSDTDLSVAEDLQRLAECDILWEMRNTV